jgi:hypothetical protein
MLESCPAKISTGGAVGFSLNKVWSYSSDIIVLVINSDRKRRL